MNLITLYLATVYLFQVFECYKDTLFRDISDDCSYGRNISTYLTSGMGVSDSCVLMIAKPEQVNCTLHFFVNRGNDIILVMEFLDWVVGEYHCGTGTNKINVVASKNEIINVCTYVQKKKDNIFRSLGKSQMSVDFQAPNNLDTVKIIATSVRDSADNECSVSEIKCPYEERAFCMTEEVLCDENLNCGIKYQYDEDKNKCEEYLIITPAMIIVGLGISLLTFALMTALLKKFLPNRKGTFIFKEDETLSEKDKATSQKEFQVKIRVLYDSRDFPNMEAIRLNDYGISIPHPKVSFRKINMSKRS